MDAHRLVHLGHERGVQELVIERLFRAHFTENRSLFDSASLTALGTEAGLDDVETFLRTRRYEDAVIADHRRAHELRVRGVPFFLIDGRDGISGAQSTEVFSQALARAHTSLGRHPQSG
jgi:predicted DsbA family dithiol-disulfide isomerase